jgi:hypothetical protein
MIYDILVFLFPYPLYLVFETQQSDKDKQINPTVFYFFNLSCRTVGRGGVGLDQIISKQHNPDQSHRLVHHWYRVEKRRTDSRY